MSEQSEQNKDENKDKLLDHNYDGIQEYDNPLPMWWVFIFVGTVIFAAIYYYMYTFGGALTQKQELEINLAKIEAIKPSEKPSKSTNDLLALAKDETTLNNGKLIYADYCAACHLESGGGMIGPNLADKFWINGDGSLQAIQTVIAQGVPDKGMIAWEDALTSDEIAAVTIYVKSFANTNPSDAKPAQGQKYNN
jgi:cytochrome c oxidase cbb3-type subunit III